MYERFYQLRERPFALSPDPEYLYPSRVHKEALSYLRYGIESHAGFLVITGEVGSGKTTLVQSVLRGLDSDTTVARIVNTMLEPRELLEAIMLDLGLEPEGKSKPAMVRDLALFLVNQRTAGRLVLLVIDEAQNLGVSALEELRMLSNLETEKSKLMQIVLLGQPGLRDKLTGPDLEQLRQRITVSYHLQALDAEETAAYINHRLRRAAIGAPLEFSRELSAVIHERSRGVPRMINVICDAVLLFGYGEERHAIDQPLLDEALVELERTGVLFPAGHAAPQTPQRIDAARSGATAAMLAAAGHAGAVRAGAAPRVSTTLQSQQEWLRARERHLAEREEQLIAQQRILAEQLRLLRNVAGRGAQVVPATSPDGAPGAGPWPPQPPQGSPPMAQAGSRVPPRPAHLRAGHPSFQGFPAHPKTFWSRVRQTILGTPEPVLTDRP